MATEAEIDDPGETPDAEPETSDRETKPTEPTRSPVKPTKSVATAARREPETEPPATYEEALEELERVRRRLTSQSEIIDRHKRKVEEFRTVAEEKQREQDAKLSEVERLGKRLTTIEREKADADATVASLQDQLIKARKAFAVRFKALTYRCKHAEDAPRLVDLDAIECDDDDEPLDASVEKAVKKLMERRPGYFEGDRGGTPSRDVARRGVGGPGRPGSNDPHEQDLAAMGLGGRM